MASRSHPVPMEVKCLASTLTLAAVFGSRVNFICMFGLIMLDIEIFVKWLVTGRHIICLLALDEQNIELLNITVACDLYW